MGQWIKAFLPVQKHFRENLCRVHQESIPGALKLGLPRDRMVLEGAFPLYRKV